MMRRVLSSAALSTVTKAVLLRRCAPSVAAMSPLVTVTQRRRASYAALADATRREMDDEQQRSGKPTKPQLPEGWTLDRKAGELVFTLRRAYKDEEILIRFIRMDDTEANVMTIDFNTCVTCKGKTLMYDMSYEDGAVILRHVSFWNDANLALDESAEAAQKHEKLYEGPSLQELDEGLVDALTSYLKERGVDEAICEFMQEYISWAEQAEYEEWLSAINRFVS